MQLYEGMWRLAFVCKLWISGCRSEFPKQEMSKERSHFLLRVLYKHHEKTRICAKLHAWVEMISISMCFSE